MVITVEAKTPFEAKMKAMKKAKIGIEKITSIVNTKNDTWLITYQK